MGISYTLLPKSQLHSSVHCLRSALVGERKKGRKGLDHDGKFLCRSDSGGAQEKLGVLSCLWHLYRERPYVISKAPELTFRDLGLTSRFSACWLC